MGIEDQEIKAQADMMRDAVLSAAWVAQQAQIASQGRLDEANERHLQNTVAVTELCGRFAVWGTENNIPYNSPSPLAMGWLLGHRVGQPTYSGSMCGESFSGGSDTSLLVSRSGNIRELVIRNAWRGGKRRPKWHLFSREAQIGDFTMSSVQESIAAFSVKHGVEWPS